MVSHTEAKNAFKYIMEGKPTYPFNAVLFASKGRVPILTSMAYLWVYFRGIHEGRVGDFKRARECFFHIASFVPEHVVNLHYRTLLEYFCQGLTHTPLNLYSPNLRYLTRSRQGGFFGEDGR